MKLNCPKCGRETFNLQCFNNGCSWRPSIADQIAYNTAQRESFERQLNGEDYTMEIVYPKEDHED